MKCDEPQDEVCLNQECHLKHASGHQMSSRDSYVLKIGIGEFPAVELRTELKYKGAEHDAWVTSVALRRRAQMTPSHN